MLCVHYKLATLASRFEDGETQSSNLRVTMQHLWLLWIQRAKKLLMQASCKLSDTKMYYLIQHTSEITTHVSTQAWKKNRFEKPLLFLLNREPWSKWQKHPLNPETAKENKTGRAQQSFKIITCHSVQGDRSIAMAGFSDRLWARPVIKESFCLRYQSAQSGLKQKTVSCKQTFFNVSLRYFFFFFLNYYLFIFPVC